MVAFQANEICDCIEKYNREVNIINLGTLLSSKQWYCLYLWSLFCSEVMVGELVKSEEGVNSWEKLGPAYRTYKQKRIYIK